MKFSIGYVDEKLRVKNQLELTYEEFVKLDIFTLEFVKAVKNVGYHARTMAITKAEEQVLVTTSRKPNDKGIFVFS